MQMFDFVRFYHIKNLQSTKTVYGARQCSQRFYHIKNLQSTKTHLQASLLRLSFITLRIYKVLKRVQEAGDEHLVLSH